MQHLPIPSCYSPCLLLSPLPSQHPAIPPCVSLTLTLTPLRAHHLSKTRTSLINWISVSNARCMPVGVQAREIPAWARDGPVGGEEQEHKLLLQAVVRSAQPFSVIPSSLTILSAEPSWQLPSTKNIILSHFAGAIGIRQVWYPTRSLIL